MSKRRREKLLKREKREAKRRRGLARSGSARGESAGSSSAVLPLQDGPEGWSPEEIAEEVDAQHRIVLELLRILRAKNRRGVAVIQAVAALMHCRHAELPPEEWSTVSLDTEEDRSALLSQTEVVLAMIGRMSTDDRVDPVAREDAAWALAEIGVTAADLGLDAPPGPVGLISMLKAPGKIRRAAARVWETTAAPSA